MDDNNLTKYLNEIIILALFISSSYFYYFLMTDQRMWWYQVVYGVISFLNGVLSYFYYGEIQLGLSILQNLSMFLAFPIYILIPPTHFVFKIMLFEFLNLLYHLGVLEDLDKFNKFNDDRSLCI